jgi:hypothetical protein
MTEFWVQQPTILFKKQELLKLWPYENMSFNEKLNATSRFVILITLLGYAILANYTILLMGVILLLIVVIIHQLYKKKVKESMNMGGFELDQNEIQSNNPMSNILLTDYVDNPDKKAAPMFSETVEEEINRQTKNFIFENNKENKDIGNIFNNMGDNFEFEKSMRQFYINPSTTIPNGQKEFTDFCYGTLYSEKPLVTH